MKKPVIGLALAAATAGMTIAAAPAQASTVPTSGLTVRAVNGTTASGVELVNQHSGLCLDGSVSLGVRLNTCNGGRYQLWYSTTGWDWKNSAYSNECLDGSISVGVRLNTCNGGAYQKWGTTNGYDLRDMAYSSECLDGSVSQGVRLNGCNGGDYQSWYW